MPIVVFAFLFGISMDYQVFVISRMRESYDRTRSTPTAVVEGIGRTGRLVTSAALILGLAFVAFSSTPGTEAKMFATALGGGILIDATIIRGLLVPVAVAILGRWTGGCPHAPHEWHVPNAGAPSELLAPARQMAQAVPSPQGRRRISLLGARRLLARRRRGRAGRARRLPNHPSAPPAEPGVIGVVRAPAERLLAGRLRRLRCHVRTLHLRQTPATRTPDGLGSWATPEQGETMEVGPVDVYIIGFPGNKFSGKIAPAIRELVDSGTIRILDLLFVMKDQDGTVTTLAIEDLDQDGAAFAELDITEPGSLNDEDADEVSEDLPPNSAALLLAFENVWATKVVSALADADAVLIDSIRIPAEVVAQARAEAAAGA
jgi:uncharacterized membrane protein